MFIADPGVTGDTEQVETHVKGDTPGDRGKGAMAVREVTGILPEEMPDKRLSQCFVAGILHKKMLQFPSHASQVEDPVSQFHAFKVDDDYPEPVTEEDVGRGHIPMDKYLLVLPHATFFSPPIFEPVKLLRFTLSCVAPLFQVFQDLIKIRTGPVKFYPGVDDSAIVHGSQKIGKGSELLEEDFSISQLDRVDD